MGKSWRTVVVVVVGFAGLYFVASPQVFSKTKSKQPKKQSMKQLGTLLDSFEANDWIPSNSDKATLKPKYVSGKYGKALSLEYSLKDNEQWVAVIKDLSISTLDRKAIELYVKTSGGKKNRLEVKLIDEDGTNYGYKVDLKGTSDWEKVTIDATDFVYWWGGDPKLDAVKQIGLAVSPDQAGAGTLFIDEIRLVPSTRQIAEKISNGTVDDCESTNGWKVEFDQGASAILNTWFGKQKDSLVLKYDMGAGNWVQMHKMQPLELSQDSTIRFWLKWGGDINSVEFKVADFDRSNFGKKFENLTKPDQWQEFTIPVSELVYLYGGDDKLDSKNVIGIWVAVTRNKGGKGTVAIDSIQLQ